MRSASTVARAASTRGTRTSISIGVFASTGRKVRGQRLGKRVSEGFHVKRGDALEPGGVRDRGLSHARLDGLEAGHLRAEPAQGDEERLRDVGLSDARARAADDDQPSEAQGRPRRTIPATASTTRSTSIPRWSRRGREAKACGPVGDRRRSNCADIDPRGAKRSGGAQRRPRVPQDPRDHVAETDGARADRREPVPELPRRRQDPFATLRLLSRHPDPRQRCRGDRRTQAGREHERARPVPQPRHESRAARHERSSCTEGLSERTRQRVRADAHRSAEAPAFRAEDPERVRFIHDQRGVVGVAKGPQRDQVGPVGVHAEIGLRHDECVPRSLLRERALDGSDVQMRDDDEPGP